MYDINSNIEELCEKIFYNKINTILYLKEGSFISIFKDYIILKSNDCEYSQMIKKEHLMNVKAYDYQETFIVFSINSKTYNFNTNLTLLLKGVDLASNLLIFIMEQMELLEVDFYKIKNNNKNNSVDF